MPGPVYSTQFVALGGFSGVGLVQYHVPFARLAVVKTMAITVGANVTPGNAVFRHQPSNAIMYSTSFRLTDLPTIDWETQAIFGTWVLNEAEEIWVETTGGWIADFFASGYLLDLP